MSPKRRQRRSDVRAQSELKDRSHPYISMLLRGERVEKSDRRVTIVDLKSERDDVVHYILRYIEHYPPIAQRWLGSLFPVSYDEFASKMLIPEASAIEDELRWNAILLSRHSERLSAFIERLSEFTKALLITKCDLAESVFDSISRTMGHSLWSIEAGVLLAAR